MSTHNICFFWEIRKISAFFGWKKCIICCYGKGENYSRKYFLINFHERMLPDPAGVKPPTSWSPVGRASDSTTETGLRDGNKNLKQYKPAIIVSWGITVKNWLNVLSSYPKPDRHNINTYIKSGENLLRLTQVTVLNKFWCVAGR